MMSGGSTRTGDACRETTLTGDSLNAVLDQVSDGVYFVDRERRITYWSSGAQRITGYSAEEMVGTRCRDGLLMHVDDSGTCLCHEGCPLAATIADGRQRGATVYVRHKQGHRVPVAVRSAPLHDEHGQINGAVETFADHSRRDSELDRLGEAERIVYVDPVTGLGNRRFFEMAFEARMIEWRRFERPFGLMLADLEQFQRINDEHGRAAGDRVLGMVARTLAAATRTGDSVCRFGGDEFVLLLNCPDARHLELAAHRISVLVRSAVLHADHASLGVTLSIGALMAAGDDPGSLLVRAHALLTRAKRAGGPRITIDRTARAEGALCSLPIAVG